MSSEWLVSGPKLEKVDTGGQISQIKSGLRFDLVGQPSRLIWGFRGADLTDLTDLIWLGLICGERCLQHNSPFSNALLPSPHRR
jgi:hypothetical protein